MPGSESIDISSSIDTILLRSPSSIGDNDSMPSTPCTRTSSDESHTIPTPPRVAPTPIITNKHGRDSNAPPPPQTWLAWLSEQFTTQYTFPPAYAQGVLQVRRIRAEERALIEFFGDEYREYKQKVGTGLPFIK
uniref:Uncharacterized protein n=1 Tax=Melanopsichium pennsylvanicum 4 TaxID=1398559 RepID=A0A077QSA2_9BASI|nr:uncharacterized protein BN887_00870 [Melanopsichium pennsylvanicum 4]